MLWAYRRSAGGQRSSSWSAGSGGEQVLKDSSTPRKGRLSSSKTVPFFRVFQRGGAAAVGAVMRAKDGEGIKRAQREGGYNEDFVNEMVYGLKRMVCRSSRIGWQHHGKRR